MEQQQLKQNLNVSSNNLDSSLMISMFTMIPFKRGHFWEFNRKQNIGDNQVYDIIDKVKDSFDVRKVRIGKPFYPIAFKRQVQKLQAFIYQPDRGTYYVIDFRFYFSLQKTRPILIKTRTIAGSLDGSLSEALSKEGVDNALANKLTKVYAWSIDFFKLKKAISLV